MNVNSVENSPIQDVKQNFQYSFLLLFLGLKPPDKELQLKVKCERTKQ